MTTQLKNLPAVVLALIGLMFAQAAPADELSLSPSHFATVGEATGSDLDVAVDFALDGLPEESGLRIDDAFLEWVVPIAGATGTPVVTLQAITSDWSTGSDGVVVETSAPLVSDWELTPLDRERNGGLVRLDLGALVDDWRSGVVPNHGVLIAVRGLSATALAADAPNCRLRIRYGFVD